MCFPLCFTFQNTLQFQRVRERVTSLKKVRVRVVVGINLKFET